MTKQVTEEIGCEQVSPLRSPEIPPPPMSFSSYNHGGAEQPSTWLNATEVEMKFRMLAGEHFFHQLNGIIYVPLTYHN